LDNSIEIVEGNTSRRVGIDINGDFVVLDETSPVYIMVMLELGVKLIQIFNL